MLSELTDANISNISPGNWVAEYVYKENGDMVSRTINSDYETFDYNGHQITDADGNNLSWDKNGQLTVGVDVNIVWNWDRKLRSAESDGNTISMRYDPSGNRIFKNSSVAGNRKYIVDIVGDLPVILLELDPNNNNNIEKTYIYANSQILAQHDGNNNDPLYFYLHDRLGSVRQVIDSDANVVNLYTYEPFGQTIENEETLSNPFMYTGQYFDFEIDEYYLRARQYNPYIGRFTSRDPVRGQFKEPLTLHRYLYCLNDPMNQTDPTGELLDLIWSQGIIGKMRAKIAGAGLAARLAVDKFVTTLNLRAAWIDFKLSMIELKDFGVWGAVKIHNLFAEVAWYGNKALIVLHEYLANRTNLTTWDEQRSFINSAFGDPALPSDWAGVRGAAVHAAGEKMYEELGDEKILLRTLRK